MGWATVLALRLAALILLISLVTPALATGGDKPAAADNERAREAILRVRGQGNVESALAQARALLQRLLKSGQQKQLASRVARDIGDMLLEKQKPQDALACFKQSVALMEGDAGPGSQHLDPCLLRLAQTYMQLHQYKPALDAWRRLSDLRLNILPADNAECTEAIRPIFQCLHELHDDTGASALLRQFLRRPELANVVRKQAFLHAVTVPGALGDVLGQNAVEQLDSTPTGSLPAVDCVESVAEVVSKLSSDKQYKHARELLTRLDKRIAAASDRRYTHWRIWTVHELGELSVLLSDYAAAGPYYQRELSLQKDNPDHEPIVSRAILLSKYGVAIWRGGGGAAAKPVLEEAVCEADKEVPASQKTQASALSCLGSYLLQNHEYKQAQAVLARHVRVVRAMYGMARDEYLQALDRYSIALWRAGDIAKLKPVLQECLELRLQKKSSVPATRYADYQKQAGATGDAKLARLAARVTVQAEGKR